MSSALEFEHTMYTQESTSTFNFHGQPSYNKAATSLEKERTERQNCGPKRSQYNIPGRDSRSTTVPPFHLDSLLLRRNRKTTKSLDTYKQILDKE